MSLSQDIIDSVLRASQGEKAYSICEKLHDANFEAWWVGGCVRDMALRKIPSDIDICTDAHPEEVEKLFDTVDMTSQELGSVFVSIGTEKFEVTTFREDDQVSDGRHPESVVFSTREKDAARRDITINALYWNPISKELEDTFNGLHDLDEKLVRFIGDPATRIQHDALRVLRAVRFRATVSGQYHPDTYKALSELVHVTSSLSGTRVLRELEKMLLCPHPEIALEDLWELGILSYIFPELHSCKGIAQPADYHKEGDVWEHTKQCVGSSTEEHGIDVRIAALFHDIGKVDTFSLKERIRFDEHASVSGDLSNKILERLQCSKKRIEKIHWLVTHHMMMGAFEDMNDERKAHWYFHPWFQELLQLFWLDIAGTTPSHFSLLNSITDDYNKFLDARPRPPKRLLSGDEVMDILGMEPGEEVGKCLQLLHDAQVRKEISTKQEAIDFLIEAKGV